MIKANSYIFSSFFQIVQEKTSEAMIPGLAIVTEDNLYHVRW